MATITKYKIDGIPTEPFREALDVTVNAEFGTESQASLNIEAITLVDSAGALNSQKLLQLWQDRPTEGAPFSIEISNTNISFDFDFYFDYNKMRFLSEVETEIGLIKQRSLDQFDFRSQGITQTLLNVEGILSVQDFQPIPYVVENRKTNLEKLQILSTGFVIIKSLADEIHKIINIASDLVSGVLAFPIATANLASTLLAITNIAIQLETLLESIQESFFPPVRYHSGIKPKTFIDKAVIDYMGYDGVEYGTLTDIMNELSWCGSKNNEKGIPQYNLLGGGTSLLYLSSGLFKPSDNGYFLSDTIAILTNQFRLRRAIINNVLHLRPETDPFWTNQSGFTMPSIKVEQIFAQNGTIRPNYDEINASTIIRYSVDDSDLWTLEDLANEDNPDTTGKIISVTTLRPDVATDQRRTVLRNSKTVEIPHCLASRKDSVDDLLQEFLGINDEFGIFKTSIENAINAYSSTLGAANPSIAEFLSSVGNRTGAMKVENDYFSIPKQMLLTTTQLGLPNIPADFTDKIGAKALYKNYHIWDSPIPGNRNPNNPDETSAHYVYEDVKIPFGLDDFATTLNNAYFTTQNGETGKFISIDWNVRGDFAIVSYWIYKNWLTNVIETIS